ncbi:hypothetical protein [Hymenobacter weizhouensis]|uniref:hypothetical protein n=1 Tax=Hymenobacter sp. YIM 151500-1 TaxID=2987689 RepID=UPI002226207B|nr:hypothetical protein [Hymenobacter sp. YIM 151500-1]UYZ64183.1 hypothetical protein OIS53_04880 [Hymenobacter sp. YIM 151500-1]
MRNFFAAILFTSALCLEGPAQAGQGDGGRINARASELTRRMAERTRMSEGQYVKVRQLNRQMLTETSELRRRYANDEAALDKAMAEAQLHYEWDLAAILGPKQLAAYDDLKTNFTASTVR